MSEQVIPTFRSTHDPDDTASRNIDIGGFLRRVAGVVASYSVTLDEDNSPDATLAISAVTYDTTYQRISFNVTGGTPAVADPVTGVVPEARYRIRLRLLLADGRQYDQSVDLLVRQH